LLRSCATDGSYADKAAVREFTSSVDCSYTLKNFGCHAWTLVSGSIGAEKEVELDGSLARQNTHSIGKIRGSQSKI
jgi:hypothetical protein